MKTIHVSHLFYLPLSMHFGKYRHFLRNILLLAVAYSVVDQMDNLHLYPVQFQGSSHFVPYVVPTEISDTDNIGILLAQDLTYQILKLNHGSLYWRPINILICIIVNGPTRNT